jgi:ABC-type nitrate/sulfonate/bicarbonate transport system substrate-binding protein
MTVSRRATLAMVGAAGSIPFFARAAAAELTSIRLGIIPIESSCLAFYAKENGFFQSADLDVAIVYADRLVASQVQPWIDVTAKYAKFSPCPSAELIYNR